MRLLDASDALPLSVGCACLGCGGGGRTLLPRLLLEQALRRSPLELWEISEISITSVAVGLIGDPEIDQEKLPSGRELCAAIARLERDSGAMFGAVVPQEIGGSNGLYAALGAVQNGLPLIDGDLMGRANPRVTMSTLYERDLGVDVSSGLRGVLSDSMGRYTGFPAEEPTFVEGTVRAMATVFGGVAALAIGPVDISVYGWPRVVSGTVSLALQIGKALVRSVSIEAFVGELGAVVDRVFRGRVEIMERDDTDDVHRLAFIRLGDGQFLRLDMHSEFTLLSIDGEVVSQAPNVFFVVDEYTLQPLFVEDIIYGLRIAVICTQ